MSFCSETPAPCVQLCVELPLLGTRYARTETLEAMLPSCDEKPLAAALVRGLNNGGVLCGESSVVLYAYFPRVEALYKAFPCVCEAVMKIGGNAWISEGVVLSWCTPAPCVQLRVGAPASCVQLPASFYTETQRNTQENTEKVE